MSEPLGVTPKDIQLDVDVAKQRVQIIQSVLAKGLLPAAELEVQEASHLQSNDKRLRQVFGSIFPSLKDFQGPGTYSNEEDAIEESLYRDNYSCLVVAAERASDNNPWQNSEEDRRRAQERIASTFLIVCGDQNRDYGRPNVKPEEFQAILFPEPIWKQYINSTKASTELPNVYVITETIKRKVMVDIWTNFKPELEIPNYESAIKDIWKRAGKSYGIRPWFEERLWLHAVRLPTSEDLKH